jgi:ferredoxin
MCRAVAPDVFLEDDEGLTVVADASGVSLETVLEIAASCPVGAILVTDAAGRPLEQ